MDHVNYIEKLELLTRTVPFAAAIFLTETEVWDDSFYFENFTMPIYQLTTQKEKQVPQELENHLLIHKLSFLC